MSDPVPEWDFIERTTAALVRQQTRERDGVPSADRYRSTLISRRGDEITPEPIDWLWPGRIARGKITVFAGHPGTGKSQVTSAIVATVSRAGQWPVDRTRAPDGSAVILSAEDDAANTIIPRLIAAGADVSRVHIVDAVHTIAANGTPLIRGVDLGRDIAALETLLECIGDVTLIVIDIGVRFAAIGSPTPRNPAAFRSRRFSSRSRRTEIQCAAFSPTLIHAIARQFDNDP